MTRISKNKLIKYNRTLGVRDKAVLNSIRLCKFIKTEQVKRLHFDESANPSAALRAATRNLTKLHELGLIQPLKRRIGGVRAGSASYVWTLKPAGTELLQLSGEIPTTTSRKRVFEPTHIFLKHTLEIAELYVRLHTATNLVKAEFEPECWRGHTTEFGANTTLKPDLFAVTRSGDYEDYWFFEVDLDTEAPSRILRKCENYGRYYLAEIEQERFGVFPQVVWIVPDEKRKETLKRHIGESLSEYAKLFAVVTFDEVEMLWK